MKSHKENVGVTYCTQIMTAPFTASSCFGLKVFYASDPRISVCDTCVIKVYKSSADWGRAVLHRFVVTFSMHINAKAWYPRECGLCGWITAKAEHVIHHNIPTRSPIKTIKPPKKTRSNAHNLVRCMCWLSGCVVVRLNVGNRLKPYFLRNAY